MPLPALLLAKLQKRGILNDGPKQVHEEVIVEDHGSDEISPEQYIYERKNKSVNIWQQNLKNRFKETTKGVKGCPNKWNVHHVCTVFCLERWGQGTEKPSKKYKERFNRLLERYPLPKKRGEWVYVWDSGCEAYYFWNKVDDTVSWLPPKHPSFKPSKSAAALRSEKDRPDMEANEEPEMSSAMMPPSSRSPPPSEERYVKPIAIKKTKTRDLEKILKTKKGRKQFYENSNTIDPMDPASYSDIPRGRWSAGLVNEERAADSTASGPLFQQRPYPSPGDVLRAQGKRKEDQEDRSDEETDKRRRYSDEME